jgi:Fur family ferric uptake transcriptional regulator
MRKSKPERPEEQQRFETFLRSRQLKLTGERLDLVEEVFGQPHHFDADQLHLALKQKGKAISRATVYRTLDLLVQCGLVRKSSLGDQHAHYEAMRSDEHHDHLICLNCDAIIEFFRPDLEALQEEICQSFSFKPMHHSHQIFGLCQACQAVDAGSPELAHRLSQLNT